MKLVLYLALLYTCYFLAIGADPVGAKRKKCYYVDKYNNKLRLVSHQRGTEKSTKHKPVAEPKELDIKHQSHSKYDQKRDNSNDDFISMSQLAQKPDSDIYNNTGTRVKHHGHHYSHDDKKNKTEVEHFDHRTQPKNQDKPDFKSKSTIDLKSKSDKATKDPKHSDSNHFKDVKPEQDSKKQLSGPKDQKRQSQHSTKPKNHSTKPEEDKTKPARVHYHTRPSDSSLDIHLSSAMLPKYQEYSSDPSKYKDEPSFNHKSEKSNLPLTIKHKNDHNDSLSSKSNRNKDSNHDKEFKDQPNKSDSNLKHESDKHKDQNATINEIQSVNEESNQTTRVNSEYIEPESPIQVESKQEDPTINSSEGTKQESTDSDQPTNDTNPVINESNLEIESQSKEPIPSSDLSSNSVEKGSALTNNTQSDSPADEAIRPLFVNSINPSEPELNDFQKEIAHVVAFLQKLVTYGPVVNPRAYNRAPKCPEYSERRVKYDSMGSKDSKEHEVIVDGSQSEKSQPVESNLDVPDPRIVSEQQSADQHIEEFPGDGEEISSNRTEQETDLVPSDSSQSEKLQPFESNLDLLDPQPAPKQQSADHITNLTENVEQMSSNGTEQETDLKPLYSLSNTNLPTATDIIEPIASNQQPIEVTIESTIDKSVMETNADHAAEANTPASEPTTQPQTGIQENNSIIDNSQPESINPESSPILDIKYYINSLLASNLSSNPLENPNFETVFIPNPHFNQTEGSGTESQSEMIPMVVPYQSKENLSEVMETSAPDDQVTEPMSTDEPQNRELETNSSVTDPEPSTEASIEPEVVESSVQESTQSPAPVTTPGNPWLMHIFGKFSHLVNWK